MSLRAKILILFAMFAVLPVLAIAVVDHLHSIHVLRELGRGPVASHGPARARFLLFTVSIVLATSLAFSLVISRIMRSLEQLIAAAEEIGRGDFRPWLPPPGDDEVGRLSLAIGRMVEKLGEMLREVEESRQMAAVGELASYLAHEIRNPLSSIKLNLQGLAREARTGSISDEFPDVIETCILEIKRLDRVVHAVLRLGQPDRGTRVPCSIHDLIDDAIILMSPDFDRRNVRVEVRRQAFYDRILASNGQLKGVLLNLFLNAAEAMPNGGRIRVWSRNAEGADGRPTICVHIADDGAGIPGDLRERIFQPFFTTKKEGTGIGLPLALRTLREHGGSLAYEKSSELEPGAEFVIRLPLHGDEAPATGRALDDWSAPDGHSIPISAFESRNRDGEA